MLRLHFILLDAEAQIFEHDLYVAVHSPHLCRVYSRKAHILDPFEGHLLQCGIKSPMWTFIC